MTAAWAAICCMRPPCAGVAVRQQHRLTYTNIKARGEFTLNIPRSGNAAEVDYLGIVSGAREPDKLERMGLTASPASEVAAPIIDACPVNVECRVRETTELGTHTWFIGEIVEVHVDEELLNSKDKIDVKALDPLIYCTSQNFYFRLGDEVAPAFSVGKSLRK